jgi:hypothetical protein
VDEPIEKILGIRDERISDIFYYFEALTTLTSGRTVGRKIGVVQEIILRRYLEQSDALRRRMYLEQQLRGRSGATHKVEFSWHPLQSETVESAQELPGSDGLKVAAIDFAGNKLRLNIPGATTYAILDAGMPTPRTGPLRKHLDRIGKDLRIYQVDRSSAVVDIVDRKRLIASLESKRVGAQRFSGSDKLGSGIQTIEKAKQASLVAIDLDLEHNGNVKPLEEAGSRKQLLSLVALGNGVHWTAKDKAVLGTYVDFTFLVKDSAIIRYAEYLREMAGEDIDFMEYFMAYFKGMTKQEPDDFLVRDDDFSIIVPEAENRSLLQVLEEHVLAVDE